MSTLKAAIKFYYLGENAYFFFLPALPSECYFQLYGITLCERTVSILFN